MVLRRDPSLPLVGLGVTVLLHGGLFGALWWKRQPGGEAPPPLGVGTFVDAQLVRFGKPRDLTFLPHKQGAQPQFTPETIKLAKDEKALPRLEEPEPEKPARDPLKTAHAELFKNLPDDREGVEDTGEGSLTGSKAGTATEAKGDPYILALIDQIGTAWTVPTTIPEAVLRELSADACLTIDAGGALTRAELIRPSGNSQFDSSLEATLHTIKQLPAPPDRFRAAAARGKLCPTFTKQ